MNQITRDVITAVISAVVVGLGGYFLIAHQNQIEISHLQADIRELKDLAKESNLELSRTKLFIAAAHPSQDIGSLASLQKLDALTTAELDTLASGLETGAIQFDANNELVEAPPPLVVITEKYDLDREDLATYSQIIDAPLSDEPRL
ncbi:hypothetical protein [Almyronema epifaneia]|uniref:Uncharacterized protein n=1 Tax=Almyronema epifaneia S1 TaxID=2991925 RepID=A0ABW6IC49_9CYAN